MTACRVKRPGSRSPILAGLAIALFATAAAAQTGGPTLLRPPPRPGPAAPQESPAPALPLQGPAGIEVENVRPLDLDVIGLIDATQGGFGTDLWAASNRLLIERLVRDLPGPLASQPLRQLAWRSLATIAAPPRALDSGKGANFAAMRAIKLRGLGDLPGAADLAQRVPGRASDAALSKMLIDDAFIAGDSQRACGLVRETFAQHRDVPLQKALMFCQALAGDGDRAQLGLAMLRDQGVPEDAGFVTLLLATGGDGKGVKLDSLRNADALALAMLRAAKVPPPLDAAQSQDPAVLAALALGDIGTADMRLAAAERGEAFGSLPTAKLAALYAAIELTPAQLADAAGFARTDGGPRGRAALVKAALAAPAGTERLTALQALWRHGRERGGYATLARVSVPLLAEIPASPEFSAAAPEAARALLMAGSRDLAAGWLRLLSIGQIGGDAAAELEAARGWLLGALAGMQTSESERVTRLDQWRASLEKSDPRTASARLALGVTLLSGLGHLPPGGALVAMPPTAMDRQPASLPHPMLWTGLHEAAIGGRVGESALLVVHLLGAEGAAGASLYTLLAVLDGIRAVGLEEIARQMALEAAIASGL